MLILPFLRPPLGLNMYFSTSFSFGSEIGFPFPVKGGNAAIGFGFNRFILGFYLGCKKAVD